MGHHRQEDRPGFPLIQLWSLALVLTIGVGFIVTTFLSGLAGGAGHVLTGAGAYIGAVLISLVLNVGVFWLGFRLATGLRVRWRDLRVGAVIAAVCWQILQVVGGYVVSHQLHRASELYGTFGIVLGLMAWLFLQAEVTLYAAEVDVVLARRLWPRLDRPRQAGAEAAETRAAGWSRRRAGRATLASPGPRKCPPPQGHAEHGGHAYEREASSWISRARRVVTRRRGRQAAR